MMEKYLIALDLDGTTIPGLYDINEYTIEVFKRIASLGHKVIITTGRPFRSSYFVYKSMKLDTFMINYNGEYVHNPITFDCLVNAGLNRAYCLDVYNKLKDKYSHIFFESYDKIYANLDDPYVYPLMHHNELSKVIAGDLNELLPSRVHGSLILAKAGCGKEIVDFVNNTFDTMRARMWKWKEYDEIVELYTTLNDKSYSFEVVRKYYGIDSDHTICFGDSMNDVDIFKLSKISVCPSNACETIKSLATIPLNLSCEECGPARWANDFFNIGLKYDNKH